MPVPGGRRASWSAARRHRCRRDAFGRGVFRFVFPFSADADGFAEFHVCGGQARTAEQHGKADHYEQAYSGFHGGLLCSGGMPQRVARGAKDDALEYLCLDSRCQGLVFPAAGFPRGGLVPTPDVEALLTRHMVKVKRPRREVGSLAVGTGFSLLCLGDHGGDAALIGAA